MVDALGWARAQLTDSDSAALDAQLLLGHVLQKSATWLHTWPEKQLSDQESAQFGALVARRHAGHPIAHILGYRDFWTLQLEVNPSTLIPRPDTEILVETALGLPLPADARVLDLGTGTGAVALALASERPLWQVTAVDYIDDAVELAKRNALAHGLQRVNILHSNWFSAISGTFDLIVSNPPYVEDESPWLNQGDVRFEPSTALTSGADGMQDIRQIAASAREFLAEGGWLALEHGFEQRESVQACLSELGYKQIETRNDLANLARVTIATR